MAKQVLTFFFIFLGLMMVMRGCQKPVDLPAAVGTWETSQPAEDDLVVLEDLATDVRVLLARNGTVVSVIAGPHSVVRSTPAWARPFHLLLVGRGAKFAIPPDNWTAEPLPLDEGGGYRFSGRKDDVVVEKTIRLAENGAGLDFKLKVDGAGGDLRGLWLTAASGVALPEADDDNRAGLFWGMSGGRPGLKSFDALVEERTSERAGRLKKMKDDEENVPARRDYAIRRELPPKAKVDRFGVLGATHYVALEGLPATSELMADVYNAKRGDGRTSEIESWLELLLGNGAYEGDFRMRWTPRDDASVTGMFGSLFESSNSHMLENDDVRIEFTDRGAAIRGMWLKKFGETAGEDLNEKSWLPILRRAVRARQRPLTLEGSSDRYGDDPSRRVWQVTRPADGRSIRFTLETRKGWRFAKTITLPEPGRFDLGVEITVEAPEGAVARDARFDLVGPAGTYIADAYRGIIGAEPPAGVLLERSGGESDDITIEDLADGEELRHEFGSARERGLLKAIGLRGAYFVCALVFDEMRDEEGRPTGVVTNAVIQGIQLERAVDRADGDATTQSMIGRVTCAIDLYNGRGTLNTKLYAGPNSPPDLRPLGISDTVDFGFFGFIGRFLMWLMKAFYGLVGSYGVAIMMLTVVVRGCLMPVSYKMQLGMQRYQKRIQKIKPLLDEIAKKYEKNPQKLNQERMRVMREHKVGFPLGCLTMFLQIPIWFALFQALRVEFSIRHQSFLWAADLSMPDALFGLPFWPHLFNLFPILMLVLWVTQQKIAPTPGSDDPQVKTQMKMMKFMPYMFFLFLYKYAAALAVYMCVSSLWSIVESKLVRKAIARQG